MTLFEKKYRIVSNDTGPGVGWTHRSKWTAAFRASLFEYVEAMAGIKSKGWSIQERKRR